MPGYMYGNKHFFNSIYIVDDDADLARTIFLFVKKFSNCDNIEIFHNPSDAADNFYNGEKPDLLITDYHMPGMNGLELSKIVKDNSPGTYRFLHTSDKYLNNKLIDCCDNKLLDSYGIKPTSVSRDLRMLLR